MQQSDLQDDELILRWKEFITIGKLNYNGIKTEIAKSWERSYACGVNKDNINKATSKKDISLLLPWPMDYRDIVITAMNHLYETIKGSGFYVVLTDSNAEVIESVPAKRGLIFTNWSEDIIGTNAIGTAIKLCKSIQISGPEHYLQQLKYLTTSAIPLFDFQGQITSVLGVIGPNNEDHTHIIYMLNNTINIITSNRKIIQNNNLLSEGNQILMNIFNLMTQGAIILSKTGIINKVNPAAVQILGIQADDLQGIFLKDICQNAHVEKMLKQGLSFNNAEIFIKGATERIHCLVSGKPNRDKKGNITGGVLILRNIVEVNSICSHFCRTRANFSFKDIIGKSKSMKDTINIAQTAANCNCSVLLQGESGTGKEIFAQSIHNASVRRNGPFIAVNCGAIPRELIGSELFGYVDGAFTGARRGGQLGKFEIASGGTLFLDEIGDMPLELQVALLRVLQEKQVTRIGDTHVIPVDVRVICATNKDLLKEVKRGNFRQDLYYRLDVISITIPPLRYRRSDIPILIKHFLSKYGTRGNYIFQMIKPEIIQYLKAYSWPGNVRELQNVIERLAATAKQQDITVRDLLPEIYSCEGLNNNTYSRDIISEPDLDINHPYIQKKKLMIADQESDQIQKLLEQYRGNITKVAQIMGFSRTTLYRRIKQYDIKLNNF